MINFFCIWKCQKAVYFIAFYFISAASPLSTEHIPGNVLRSVYNYKFVHFMLDYKTIVELLIGITIVTESDKLVMIGEHVFRIIVTAEKN